MTKRLIVAVTGASAPHYARTLLTTLHERDDVETHLVVSRASRRTVQLELGMSIAEFSALADVVHHPDDIAASISSGSFATAGMVVLPCSMRTLGAIAAGIGDDLITRAADVTLKERRRLVLAVRETPLSLIHVRNMTTVTEAGAIVMPPVPAFYTQPTSVEDIVDQFVGRVLDMFGIESDLARPWTGPDGMGGES
ncbi:UbiX family flavin prenyltransferase [Microbacter sp. GSS18]|nr:UbiX family flavin prenyltransferase [Microbacter sp. GSS18]